MTIWMGRKASFDFSISLSANNPMMYDDVLTAAPTSLKNIIKDVSGSRIFLLAFFIIKAFSVKSKPFQIVLKSSSASSFTGDI
ncbi:MAG: hypothetical protein BWX58_00355 [Deltaproteobacteria bacterium ADurb.Bin026]|nr:MAG: hypothetical protein BWX58_00355 [Deltaproteobacteria bacterium ADurb.Bin026]